MKQLSKLIATIFILVITACMGNFRKLPNKKHNRILALRFIPEIATKEFKLAETEETDAQTLEIIPNNHLGPSIASFSVDGTFVTAWMNLTKNEIHVIKRNVDGTVHSDTTTEIILNDFKKPLSIFSSPKVIALDSGNSDKFFVSWTNSYTTSVGSGFGYDEELPLNNAFEEIGGECICPESGTKYFASSKSEDCLELNCQGGVPLSCNNSSDSDWAQKSVVCGGSVGLT